MEGADRSGDVEREGDRTVLVLSCDPGIRRIRNRRTLSQEGPGSLLTWVVGLHREIGGHRRSTSRRLRCPSWDIAGTLLSRRRMPRRGRWVAAGAPARTAPWAAASTSPR